MAYNKNALSEAVQSLLAKDPGRSLASICRELGIERHTTERALRLTQGISFRECRKRILLRTALDLLREPSRSIKEIAISLGYNSPRDFSRFIRNTTGKSPTEHR